MGFLSKFRDRSRNPDAEPPPEVECAHTALVPHWDALTQVGDPTTISHFVCDICGAVVLIDMGHGLRPAGPGDAD